MSKENIILDTDMENEIDDKFALAYLIKSLDKFNLEAVTIAPFSSSKYSEVLSIEEGINKSYNTTLKIMDMLDYPGKNKVYKGAINYLKDSEKLNDATNKIIEISLKNKKTIIIAIGAITNVALAIKKEPKIVDKIKIIYLGGNSFLTKQNNEFNSMQDIKAVKTVFESGVELVVIPCKNVASNLITTTYELEHYIKDKGEIGKYLCDALDKCMIEKAKLISKKESNASIGISKTIWDISAIAYIINKNWFTEEEINCPLILKNGSYKLTRKGRKIIFINDLSRNNIFKDFFIKMGCEENEIN